MHYIRSMRAPALTRSGKRLLLDLVLTINTDLSDAYLTPLEPVEVMVYAEVLSNRGGGGGGPLIYVLAGPGKIIWRSGLRVLKPTIDIPASVQAHLHHSPQSGEEVRICVSARSDVSASGVEKIVESVRPGGGGGGGARSGGQIMPAYFSLKKDGITIDNNIGIRKLLLLQDSHAAVEFEEELGESMARHIWDGGVVALCKMTDACLVPAPDSPEPSCMRQFRDIIAARKEVNVLELGCGIGVLGVGLAAIYPRMRLPHGHRCSILMTDLEDAESRTRANISRLQAHQSSSGSSSSSNIVNLSYENLDWQDGRTGRFGPAASSRRWDLIMLADCTYNTDTLPALVETLSALHESNQRHHNTDTDISTTGGGTSTDMMIPSSPAAERATLPPSKLFLATKNRHDSEREVFTLLSAQGWETLGREVLSLPVLGAEAQIVEMYLFQKL